VARQKDGCCPIGSGKVLVTALYPDEWKEIWAIRIPDPTILDAKWTQALG